MTTATEILSAFKLLTPEERKDLLKIPIADLSEIVKNELFFWTFFILVTLPLQ